MSPSLIPMECYEYLDKNFIKLILKNIVSKKKLLRNEDDVLKIEQNYINFAFLSRFTHFIIYAEILRTK